MRSFVLFLLLTAVLRAPSFGTQPASLLGQWQEPGGSVIRIEPCPSGICMRLLAINANAPSTLDIHNPDPALRRRALCNLEIGSGFRITDATHASGGSLYDPRSGRTYRGAMVANVDTLKLRGYVGTPIFGRTEIWRHVIGNTPSCDGGALR